MSDFFTKKQKKFWCEICKIFIEYTKQCIEQHQRSKNHMRLVNQDIEYKNQKEKFKKINNMYNPQFIEQGNSMNNNNNLYSKSATYLNESHDQEELKNILNLNSYINQIDPLGGYNHNNSNSNLLNKKIQRNNQPENLLNNHQNNNSFNDNTNYTPRANMHSMSSVLLDEVKNEKIKEELNKNKKKNENNCPKSWTIYWDNNYNLPYYYNHLTGISQWDKPKEYDNLINSQFKNIPQKNNEDSDDLDESESSDYDDEKENDSKIKQGIIGKWEIIDKDQSVFNKKNEEIMNNLETPNTNNIEKDITKNIENDKNLKNENEEKDQNEIENYYFPGMMSKHAFLYNEYGVDIHEGEESLEDLGQEDKIDNLDNIKNLMKKEEISEIENLDNKFNNIKDNNIQEENKIYEKIYDNPRNFDKLSKIYFIIKSLFTNLFFIKFKLFIKIGKEEIIEINKKLKQRDYDFRYMDLKDKNDFNVESTNIKIKNFETNLNTIEPISIEIKSINFKKPKIKKNNLFNNNDE